MLLSMPTEKVSGSSISILLTMHCSKDPKVIPQTKQVLNLVEENNIK